MFRSTLTEKEVARVKSAARKAGFPWQPIIARPKAARQFYRRVEAETSGNGRLHEAPSTFLPTGC